MMLIKNLSLCEFCDLKKKKRITHTCALLSEFVKVLDKSNPYFKLEKLNKDLQSWEILWKSEVVKDTLNPTWMEARLPLQLLCNDDQKNPLKITIWDYEKHSTSHDLIGFVETTVADLVAKAKEKTIPVMLVKREKKKWFRGSKLKTVGLLKVLKASVIPIPSMLQYLSGGCSLDVMVGIDCTLTNGPKGTEKCLHSAAAHWLNDYQAGLHKLGTIMENFARGKHSSVWGYGTVVQKEPRDLLLFDEHLCLEKEILYSYGKRVVEDPLLELGESARLAPLIQEAIFRTIRASKRRQCYTVLCIFTAGKVADLGQTIDLICNAAEDAPLSIIIIGVGNRDFSAIEKLIADETGRLRDSRGIPIAREIVSFVSFKQFAGNATEVVSEVLKEIPEHFVTYYVNNGIKPLQAVPPPDFAALAAAALARGSSSSRGSRGSGNTRRTSKTGHRRSASPVPPVEVVNGNRSPRRVRK